VTDADLQVWAQTIGGVAHRVEARGGLRRHVQWYADGELVAARGGMEGKLRLADDEHGTLEVRYGGLGSPRRATLKGLDLEPAEGSPAAQFEERVRARPHLYAAIQTAGGVARVVVPLLLTLVTVRFALSFDWPDWNLPDLPSPDLPSPDLPGVPLPDVSLPGWLRWLLEHAKYVVPILVAWGLARAEIKRRQKQDELRAAHDAQHEGER
jgi:hypothetical protein